MPTYHTAALSTDNLAREYFGEAGMLGYVEAGYRTLGDIPQENLRILVDELGKAFAGDGDDLGRLIDNGDVLLEAANGRLHRLPMQLITRGRLEVEF